MVSGTGTVDTVPRATITCVVALLENPAKSNATRSKA